MAPSAPSVSSGRFGRDNGGSSSSRFTSSTNGADSLSSPTSSSNGRSFMPNMTRKSVNNSSNINKGKTPARPATSGDEPSFSDPFAANTPHSSSFVPDPVTSRSNSPTKYTASSSGHANGSGPSRSGTDVGGAGAGSNGDGGGGAHLRRNRGSLLVAAQDALGLRKKFTRRRTTRPHTSPLTAERLGLVLPEVLDISLQHDEDAERDRLRDAAAQSLGFVAPSPYDGMAGDEDGVSMNSSAPPEDEIARSLHSAQGASSIRAPSTGPLTVSLGSSFAGRLRAASVSRGGRARADTVTGESSSTESPIPPFPSTPAALSPYAQLSGSFPRYQSGGALLAFGLTKQWKPRHIVLSSPSAQPSINGSVYGRTTVPISVPASHVHLFKSGAGDEREIERLEITEASVACIADDDVGGRKNVVRIGGSDVNAGAGTPATWHLHIPDPQDAQRWIAAIKHAVLVQRSLRAGLGLPAHSAAGGDIDVMLSMRAQGLAASPTKSTFSTPDTPTRSPIGSAQTARAGSTPVTALKGLFSSSRPRSPSLSVSTTDYRDGRASPAESAHVPPSLLSVITGEPPPPLGTHIMSPREGVAEVEAEMPASPETPNWADTSSISLSPVNSPSVRTARHRSNTSVSLQPPPRKRPWSTQPGAWRVDEKTPEETTLPESPQDTPTSANGGAGGSSNGRRSPSLRGFTFFGTPEQKPRAPSLSSVSTFSTGGGEHAGGSVERSSSSVRRWSRTSVLPKRLTPPAGPPPLPPTSPGHASVNGSVRSSAAPRFSLSHPYASPTESCPRPSSRGSSVYSVVTTPSSIPASSHPYSKRSSIASSIQSGVPSIPAPSSPLSNVSGPFHSVRRTGGRLSMPPPPRPAPIAALPPTPADTTDIISRSTSLDAAEGNRASMDGVPRPSFTQRTFRHSLNPPSRPAPTSALPPRPDETTAPSSPRAIGHRRRNSAGTSSLLQSIPSTASGSGSQSPKPSPPSLATNASSLASLARHNSLRHRLRMLSAPPAPPLNTHTFLPSRTPSPAPSTVDPYTIPTTPIGERIVDADYFLQLEDSPIAPSPPPLPPPPPEGAPPDVVPEPTPLSPPPRRGSRQLSVAEKEQLRVQAEAAVAAQTQQASREAKHTPLSRHVAVGVVSL